MDLYLAAAFEAEEAANPRHEVRIHNQPDVVKKAYLACKKELDNLKKHREEHGC